MTRGLRDRAWNHFRLVSIEDLVMQPCEAQKAFNKLTKYGLMYNKLPGFIQIRTYKNFSHKCF